MSAEGKKCSFSTIKLCFVVFFGSCVSLGPLRSRSQDEHERILRETPVRRNGERARKCDRSLTLCEGRTEGSLVGHSRLLGA